MSSDVQQKYGTLLTAAGKQAIANAAAADTLVKLKYIALGDGGGTEYYPTEAQMDLKHQVYQAEANSIYIDPDNPNRIYVELAIPEQVGGFTIREVAIKTEDQVVVAIGTNPSYYKPVLAEGAAAAYLFKFIIEVTNASVVALKIDGALVFATINYVNNVVENHSKQTNVHGGTYVMTPNRLMLRNDEGRCQVMDPVVDADALNRRTLIKGIKGELADDTGKFFRPKLTGTTVTWSGSIVLQVYVNSIIPLSGIVSDTTFIFNPSSNAFVADEDITILLYSTVSYTMITGSSVVFGMSLGASIDGVSAGGATTTFSAVTQGYTGILSSFLLLELKKGDVVKTYSSASINNTVRLDKSTTILKIL